MTLYQPFPVPVTPDMSTQVCSLSPLINQPSYTFLFIKLHFSDLLHTGLLEKPVGTIQELVGGTNSLGSLGVG